MIDYDTLRLSASNVYFSELNNGVHRSRWGQHWFQVARPVATGAQTSHRVLRPEGEGGGLEVGEDAVGEGG